jgi:membrane protease subunit HflK
VDPPSQVVKNAFAEVSSSRLEKKQLINKANQEYNKTIPEARGQADKMVLEAEGEKVKRVNEAQGDVAKFSALLKEYQRAKEVTRTRLYLEALGEVLPQVRQIFIVDESQGKPLQVLDLQSAGGARRVIRREQP